MADHKANAQGKNEMSLTSSLNKKKSGYNLDTVRCFCERCTAIVVFQSVRTPCCHWHEFSVASLSAHLDVFPPSLDIYPRSKKIHTKSWIHKLGQDISNSVFTIREPELRKIGSSVWLRRWIWFMSDYTRCHYLL